METGIYVRVSTEEQAQEGFSIRAQEEKLRDFARIKDWIVHKIYIDDGISGKNVAERPAINDLIIDIKNGKVKNVLVYKIDRLTRNTIDLINFVDLFNKYDCAFNSLMESIDTQTASGRMFLKIIGIFAEFERENIIERSRLGFERKAKEGYSLCTRTASYGYDRKDGQKLQTINPIEASIVKEVFDMFVTGHYTYLDIARTLDKRGIHTKENAVWHSRTIKNMLTNCNYAGYVRYATKDEKRHFETEGLHEPIISKELYDETQELISKLSKKNYAKRPLEEHYFLGILICENCGGRFLTHGSYNKRKDGTVKVLGSYRCGNKLRKICNSPSISHKKMEKAFEEYIANIADFSAEIDIETSKKEETRLETVSAYKDKYEKLELKEREVLQLYVDSKIEFDNYMQIKKTIETEKSTINAELEKLEIQADDDDFTIRKEDIINNLRDNWELLTPAERRQFLIKFVEKIEIKIQNSAPIIKNVEFCKY